MSFAEFIRQALVNAALPTTRNKGSVKPIRPVTPRRVSRIVITTMRGKV